MSLIWKLLHCLKNQKEWASEIVCGIPSRFYERWGICINFTRDNYFPFCLKLKSLVIVLFGYNSMHDGKLVIYDIFFLYVFWSSTLRVPSDNEFPLILRLLNFANRLKLNFPSMLNIFPENFGKYVIKWRYFNSTFLHKCY